MGQVNCHCQQVLLDETHLKDFQSMVHKQSWTRDETYKLVGQEPYQLVTRVTLKNSKYTQYILLHENQPLTVGTSIDCDHIWSTIQGNSFKITMKVNRRELFIRDWGVGLGVFLLKRKFVLKPSNVQMLIQVQDRYLMMKLSQKKVKWTIFDIQSEKNSQADPKTSTDIIVGDIRILLRWEKEEYTLKRSDKKDIGMLLGSQQRIKINQRLKMGVQEYTVDGIFTNAHSGRIVVCK